MFLNPELADAVIDIDLRVTHCKCRHHPHIIISAVAFIYNTHVVCLNDPKILVLDEPTAGLDPKERVRFRNILSVLSKDRIVILSTHIVSDIESIANHVIMIKEKHLLKNDTVPNICKELEGKVFERLINESEIQEFEQKRIILSMRQESEKMMVRYYSEEEDNNARPCTPNLEDVFLVTYREEK